MKRTAFVAFVFVTMLYITIGSVVFHFIEGNNEKKEKEKFVLTHEKFLNDNPCISPEALREYILEVMEAYSQGVPVATIAARFTNSNSSSNSTNNSSNSTLTEDDDDSNWDIVSTILFCLTVVSTVGYGNLTPKTEGGQSFCIIFALIGIPLFATSLVGVGERLQIPLQHIKKGRAWYKGDPKKDAQLKTAVFLTTGILVLMFIPAGILSRTEHWSYIEALYFCVITLTTVGFGDYIPGRSRDRISFYLHRIILCVWILLGLSWVALILSELASVMKEQIMEAARKTSNKFGDFEDMVKKKAKDAREKIAQKDHKDKDHDTDGVGEEVDVYVIKNSPRISPKRPKPEDNGVPGIYRSLSSSQSLNSINDVGISKDNKEEMYLFHKEEVSSDKNESISRVDVR